MGDQPIDRVGSDQPDHRGAGQPEANVRTLPENRDQDEDDHAQRLGSANDREAGIVDRLRRQIVLLREPHLARKFECMGKQRRERQCNQQKRQDL